MLCPGPVRSHQSEPFLTRSEVAGLLRVSPTTVTRWAREGRLPCQRTLGGHHRFDLAVVEEVRERMRQGVRTSPTVLSQDQNDAH